MRRALAATVLVLSLAGCGDNSTPATHDAHPPAADGAARTPSPPGAKVFIIEPKDGATVKNPITVKFGVEGMKLVPAGTDEPDSGHHHLLIDTKLEDYNAPIPADAQHIHYGKAQTEGTIELSPGKHTLQDVFADKNHIPHEPPVQSDVITITVE
ncbi:MAG: DUF4399 domain-containing protein [Hyphomicrobium sp.]